MRYILPVLATATVLAMIAPATAGGLVLVPDHSGSHDTSDHSLPGFGAMDNTPDFDVPGFNGRDDTPDFEVPGFGAPDPRINGSLDLAPPDPRIHGKFSFGGSTPVGSKPEGGPQAAQMGAAMPVYVSCVVAGTPSEFPDDIRITNVMGAVVPAGTRFRWSVQGGLSGVVTLSKALAPGRTTGANSVIAGGVAAGTPCTIEPIGL